MGKKRHAWDLLSCPSCGYSLAGLPSSPCPECGITSQEWATVLAEYHNHGRPRGLTLRGNAQLWSLLSLISLVPAAMYPVTGVIILSVFSFGYAVVLIYATRKMSRPPVTLHQAQRSIEGSAAGKGFLLLSLTLGTLLTIGLMVWIAFAIVTQFIFGMF